MNIQPTYDHRLAVNTIRIAGNPRMRPSRQSGIIGIGRRTIAMAMTYIVNPIAAGRTHVPTNSINTTN